MSALLIRPRPFADESCCGYALRAARANSWTGWSELRHAYGLTPTLAICLGTAGIEAILDGKFANAPAAADALQVVHAASLGVRKGSTRKTRFCVVCLKEHEYWRFEWDLPLSVRCRKHKVELTDTCECGRAVTYSGSLMSHFACGCGRKYADCVSKQAPVWAPTVEAVFRPWLREPPGYVTYGEIVLEEEASARTLRAALELLAAMGTSEGYIPAGKLLWIGRIDFPAIGRVVADWPETFRMAVANSRVTAQLSGRQSSRFLRRICRSDLPDVVTALREGSVDAPLPLPRLARPKGPPPGLVTLQAYRVEARAQFKDVDALFRAGKLAGAAQSLNGETRWIAVEEMAAVRWLNGHAPKTRSAAKYLNCPTGWLRAFAQLGLLTPMADPRFPWMNRYRMSELAALVSRLTSRVVGTVAMGKSYVRLTKLPTPAGRATGWLRLMEGVRARQIPLFALGDPSNALADLVVRRADARDAYPRTKWL